MIRKRGIAFKIVVVLFSVIAVIFIAIFLYWYNFSKNIIEKNLRENSGNLAGSIVNQVEKQLLAVEKVPLNISNSLESAHFTDKELNELLKSVLEINPEIYGACIAYEPGFYEKGKKYFAPYVWRDSGKISYQILGNRESYDYFTTGWYKYPKEINKPAWSEPYLDEGGGNIVMSTYSVPFYKIIDGKKTFAGVITADISLDWLQKSLSYIKVLETGYIILISKNGTIVIHPNKNFIMRESVFSLAEKYNVPELGGMGKNMINGETGFANFSFKNLKTGIESRTYYAPIKLNGWSLGIVYPEDELMADIYSLNKAIAVLGGAGLVLLLGLIIFISRSITKPIRLLSHSTKEFASGNFDVEIPRISSKDEIGELNNSFIAMQSALRKTISDLKNTSDELRISNEKLEDYNRTLELKVEERTKEISVKNSELEEALLKIQETQQQLIMQEKMASLGVLTAGIAHEIKNPLNFINNFSELSIELSEELKEELEKNKDKISSEELEEIEDLIGNVIYNLGKINEHGKRADSIVRGMLLHSRGKSGERQETDINALILESVNLAYHGMRAQDQEFNVKIETEFDKEIGMVNIVPQDISRVLLNIVNNACYAAFERKRYENLSFIPTLSVSSRKNGDVFEIRIRDNGQGIPDDVKEKIFNPFFTTKPAGKGTGLGLSLSYEIIVQEHNGELTVNSEQGKFTEFILKIPNK